MVKGSWEAIFRVRDDFYSMKSGVLLYSTSQWEVWDYIQWMVVWELTSHQDEKCETILNEWWCESLHHITMSKCETILNEWWCVSLHCCRSQCNGCMIVVVLCCHVSRDTGLDFDVAKRIVMAAWMLHGLRFGRKPGQETVRFSV